MQQPGADDGGLPPAATELCAVLAAANGEVLTHAPAAQCCACPLRPHRMKHCIVLWLRPAPSIYTINVLQVSVDDATVLVGYALRLSGRDPAQAQQLAEAATWASCSCLLPEAAL